MQKRNLNSEGNRKVEAADTRRERETADQAQTQFILFWKYKRELAQHFKCCHVLVRLSLACCHLEASPLVQPHLYNSMPVPPLPFPLGCSPRTISWILSRAPSHCQRTATGHVTDRSTHTPSHHPSACLCVLMALRVCVCGCVCVCVCSLVKTGGTQLGPTLSHYYFILTRQMTTANMSS